MRKSKRRSHKCAMQEMRRELTLLRLLRARLETRKLQDVITRELHLRRRDPAYAQLCKDYAKLLHTQKTDSMELDLINSDREYVGLPPLSKLVH